MSDLSGFERSFVLGPEGPTPERPPRLRPLPGKGRSYEVPLPQIDFRRVTAVEEIAAVQALRAEIQLPGNAVADPGFLAREKKETGRAWSALSNGATTSSARCDSFPSAAA